MKDTQTRQKRLHMRKFILIILLTIYSLPSGAQQNAMFTQYMFNPLATNPAYAGTHDALSITMLARTQWVSIEGAPEIQTISLHSPVYKNLSLGLNIIHEKTGPIGQYWLFGDVAYKVKTTASSYLSFGIKGGVSMYQADLINLQTVDPNDAAFSKNIREEFKPNFGFGMFYYGDRFYIGASSPRLLENNIDPNITAQSTRLLAEERHYFLQAGYVFDLTEGLKFKPTLHSKLVFGAPLSVDLTANFLINEKLWLGGAYRIGDSFGGIFQINITEQFKLGYAYDYPVTELRLYAGGTHEIMIAYDFLNLSRNRVKSPRYF